MLLQTPDARQGEEARLHPQTLALRRSQTGTGAKQTRSDSFQSLKCVYFYFLVTTSWRRTCAASYYYHTLTYKRIHPCFCGVKKRPQLRRARVCMGVCVCMRVGVCVWGWACVYGGGRACVHASGGCGYAASDFVGGYSLKRKPYDSKRLSLPADIDTTWALALNVRVMSSSAAATRVQLSARHVASKMRDVSSG